MIIYKDCLVCSKKFETIPSEIENGKGKYCSRECCNIHKKTILKGSANPRWAGGKKTIICFICNKSFNVKKHEIYKRKTCSMKCAAIRKSSTTKGLNAGSKNWNWRGGIKIAEKGYISIYMPKHPFCQKKGYILRSHLVMEKHIGRYLTREEVVHHKGIKYPIRSIKNRQDDRIENLKLFKNQSKHMQFHNPNGFYTR